MTDGQKVPHSISLDERKKLTVSGVKEVVSLDEESIVLATVLGMLVVQGQDLKLKQLTTEGGCVSVVGQIESLAYEQQRQNGSLLRRLLG